MDTHVYEELVISIVEHQESIIGPVAVTRASSVQGLKLDWPQKMAVISGDPKSVIDELVEQYKALFGQISVEVCKEAVGRLAQQLTGEQLPASLR